MWHLPSKGLIILTYRSPSRSAAVADGDDKMASTMTVDRTARSPAQSLSLYSARFDASSLIGRPAGARTNYLLRDCHFAWRHSLHWSSSAQQIPPTAVVIRYLIQWAGWNPFRINIVGSICHPTSMAFQRLHIITSPITSSVLMDQKFEF